MKLEPCVGCGRMILIHRVANLVVKCDPTPLDGQGVAGELGAGRQIWTPEFGPGLIPKKLRGARPGDAKLLREHRCRSAQEALQAPVWRPNTPSPVPGAADAPKGRQGRPVAPSTPSSGPRTVHSGAPGAGKPLFNGRSVASTGFEIDWSKVGQARTAPCDSCSSPVDLDGPEERVAIELGATVVWAQHADCGGR